jgi:hypothetical protein
VEVFGVTNLHIQRSISDGVRVCVKLVFVAMAMTDDVIVARAPKDQRSKIFGEEADGPSSQYLREQSRHFSIATSRRILPATSTHGTSRHIMVQHMHPANASHHLTDTTIICRAPRAVKYLPVGRAIATSVLHPPTQHYTLRYNTITIATNKPEPPPRTPTTANNTQHLLLDTKSNQILLNYKLHLLLPPHSYY